MTKETIDYQVEENKLKQSQMFTNHGFMVTVTKKDGTVLFYPHMISNFSIDSNKIFITLYDLIQTLNIEEELDELSKGFWCFKEDVNITLYKVNSTNKEVYRVEYGKCRLKKYHGKNFTYKSNDIHQWYLEFTFRYKNIIKNKKYVFEVDNKTTNLTKSDFKKMQKKEVEILRNSNKMLDEAAKKTRVNSKSNRSLEKFLNDIENAKRENENVAQERYGETLQNFDFKEIEKEIESQIAKLEDKMNK